MACDLQHPDMRDARSRSHGAEARTAPDSLAERVAPCFLGSVTPRGCAAHTGQAVHLARGFDCGAERVDGLRRARVVEGDGDAELVGLGAQRVVVAGVLLELAVSGHSGNLAYRVVACQAPSASSSPSTQTDSA